MKLPPVPLAVTLLLVAVGVLAVLTVSWYARSTLADSTTVSIDPQTQQSPICSDFSVDAVVADVTNLGTFDINLCYDDSVVAFTDFAKRDFLESSGRTATCMPPSLSAGCVRVTCYTMGGSPPGPNGTGVLGTFTFHCESGGDRPLDLDESVSVLGDILGGDISATWQDGSVTCACPDDDDDGVCNGVDECPGTEEGATVDAIGCSQSQVDQDGDEVCDPGAPADTEWCAGSDNCPSVANESQVNSDNDSHGDACDNCPTVDNEGQADTDGDGIGDACEAIPTPTPTPTPSPGPGPVTPTPTAIPTVTPSPTPVALPGIPLVAGWNDKCYIGEEMPIEDALTGIEDKVLAIYILNPSQGFDRWFRGEPHLSTITTLSPYDQLFLLLSEAGTWQQVPSSQTQTSVNLVQGWNSVCYSGQMKPVEEATSGITEAIGILYRFLDTQTWARYVPNRPEVSNLSQLEPLASVLILITNDTGVLWVFDP